MYCKAMLFNLEKRLNKAKDKELLYLTFVDTDTGESFTTLVTAEQASLYKKLEIVNMTLSLSLNEYNGRTSIQSRILTMERVQNTVSAVPKTA